MKSTSRRALAITVALAVTAIGGLAIAQSGLSIGGPRANYGARSLRGGFLPDPVAVRVVSGGSLDASRMGMASGCRGYVTRQPDFILHYRDAASFLRFYATSGGDTTLVVNDAAGRWHCNDDSHGGLNPTVDIQNPPSGQYDVWVGSYRARENLRSTLHMTELRSQHP